MIAGKTLEGYKSQLMELARQTRSTEKGLEREALQPSGGENGGSLSNMPFHQADVSSTDYDQEVSIGLLEQEAHRIADIELALDKLEAGNYGVCEECAQEIAPARLEAIPYARYCTACATELEHPMDRNR